MRGKESERGAGMMLGLGCLSSVGYGPAGLCRVGRECWDDQVRIGLVIRAHVSVCFFQFKSQAKIKIEL